jgi:hypothetical protein
MASESVPVRKEGVMAVSLVEKKDIMREAIVCRLFPDSQGGGACGCGAACRNEFPRSAFTGTNPNFPA